MMDSQIMNSCHIDWIESSKSCEKKKKKKNRPTKKEFLRFYFVHPPERDRISTRAHFQNLFGKYLIFFFLCRRRRRREQWSILNSINLPILLNPSISFNFCVLLWKERKKKTHHFTLFLFTSREKCAPNNNRREECLNWNFRWVFILVRMSKMIQLKWLWRLVHIRCCYYGLKTWEMENEQKCLDSLQYLRWIFMIAILNFVA